jgi:hypothetical protein
MFFTPNPYTFHVTATLSKNGIVTLEDGEAFILYSPDVQADEAPPLDIRAAHVIASGRPLNPSRWNLRDVESVGILRRAHLMFRGRALMDGLQVAGDDSGPDGALYEALLSGSSIQLEVPFKCENGEEAIAGLILKLSYSVGRGVKQSSDARTALT